MRRIVCIAMLALLWTVGSLSASAQESGESKSTLQQEVGASPTTENPSGLTPEDVKQLQESAQGLRQVFGIEQSVAPVSVQTTTPQAASRPTMAEVADKAVDIVNRMVVSAVESIQKVAPDVWRIMIKQQYARAAGDLMVPAGLLITVLVLNATYLRRLRMLSTECKERAVEKKKARDTETSDGRRRGLDDEIKQAEGVVAAWVLGYGVPVFGYLVSISGR